MEEDKKYIVCFSDNTDFWFAWRVKLHKKPKEKSEYIDYTILRKRDAEYICSGKSHALYTLEEAEKVKNKLIKYFKNNKKYYKNRRVFLIKQSKFQGLYRNNKVLKKD